MRVAKSLFFPPPSYDINCLLYAQRFLITVVYFSAQEINYDLLPYLGDI